MSLLPENTVLKGNDLKSAQKAMILIHGRGGTAQNILSVAHYLNVEEYALLAPQANQNSWYPMSFLAPVQKNEPHLSGALRILEQLVSEIKENSIPMENVFFLGFSQGACLVSEFLARNATRYGGGFIFSGGLIGSEIDRSKYSGDFDGTPFVLGCSDIDPHIPLPRVKDTTLILREMGADVDERIYVGGAHTIFEEELKLANKILG